MTIAALLKRPHSPEPHFADTFNESLSLLTEGYSVEVVPAAANKIALSDHLDLGTRVFVTSLAGQDFWETFAVCQQVHREGFIPVPHITARSTPDSQTLAQRLERLTGEAGVEEALVIAGGAGAAIGDFENSMQLLETGHFDRVGLERLHIAGHPEGSPDISEEAIENALQWKRSFSERSDCKFSIVSQMAFEAEPLVAWMEKLNAAGVTFPIRLGMPGVASLKTLIKFAILCGVGNSINFLKKKAKDISKLVTVNAPDKLLIDLAEAKLQGRLTNLEALHFFPLGGLAKTAGWANAVTQGRLKMNRSGQSFKILDEN